VLEESDTFHAGVLTVGGKLTSPEPKTVKLVRVRAALFKYKSAKSVFDILNKSDL
jgi:hypothetical protein